MASGIYTITNKIDGKIYVGFAHDLKQRYRNHFRELKNNRHKNNHLQAAVNRDGIKNFLFEILWECASEFLTSEEHYWATLLQVHNDKYGYNQKPTNPHYNPGHSPETVLKMRKSACENNGKPIVVINARTNEYVCEKPSKGELAVWLGKTRKEVGNICTILKGGKRCKSLSGYTFVYKTEYNPTKDYTVRENRSVVCLYNRETKELIKEYPSIASLSNYIGVDDSVIQGVVRGKFGIYKEYIIRYGGQAILDETQKDNGSKKPLVPIVVTDIHKNIITTCISMTACIKEFKITQMKLSSRLDKNKEYEGKMFYRESTFLYGSG